MRHVDIDASKNCFLFKLYVQSASRSWRLSVSNKDKSFREEIHSTHMPRMLNPSSLLPESEPVRFRTFSEERYIYDGKILAGHYIPVSSL